ncbi:MAG: C-terminal binding protein [Desulfobacterales bacterium]|nr:C-terminal binding protein [Desulfobacterales bacterium]
MQAVVIDSGYASYDYERKLFEAQGFEFQVFQGDRHDRKGKLEFAAGAAGILVRSTQIDEDFLSRLPNLKALVRYGVGYDNVDLNAAKRHGVRVAYVPGYANQAVSDHALALLLSCARLLPIGQQNIKQQFGKPPASDTLEMADKTLGIVGLGRIGGTLCTKAQLLFKRVLAVDPYIPAERFGQLSATPCDLSGLLAESDAISLHCNLTPETHNLINAAAFAQMHRRPILVNTARGEVVDPVALLEALQGDMIHSAGIDVFPNEPPGDALAPLLSHPRLIATGHYAWYSVRSSQNLQQRAADNLLAMLQGKDIEDELTGEIKNSN